jgi:hypothetical protein
MMNETFYTRFIEPLDDVSMETQIIWGGSIITKAQLLDQGFRNKDSSISEEDTYNSEFFDKRYL